MKEIPVQDAAGQAREPSPAPFRVKDCSIIRISTGLRAQNLRELLVGLRQAPSSSLYHHFWGRLLEPTFEELEYPNDFAAWAARGLNDRAVAERLGTIDPSDFHDLEDLRQAVVETIEARLDESEMVPWARADAMFYFVWSQLVVFETPRCIERPEALAAAVAQCAPSSIFYHFIDARRRPPMGENDFALWLSGFGERYQPAVDALHSIDPYMNSLLELRRHIALALEGSLPGREP